MHGFLINKHWLQTLIQNLSKIQSGLVFGIIEIQVVQTLARVKLYGQEATMIRHILFYNSRFIVFSNFSRHRILTVSSAILIKTWRTGKELALLRRL